MAISFVLRALLLGPVLLAGSACSYLSDRAVDFLDQYRVAVGVGPNFGVRGRSLGLFDTGLMFGMKPRDLGIGWRYSRVAWPGLGGGAVDADQAEILFATSIVGLDYTTGAYKSARRSFALFPALLSWVDTTPDGHDWEVPEEGDDFEDELWIWSPAAIERGRYAQVHAFDIESEVAFLFYFDVGYSPGEFIDFLLGIATIDIAQDDGRVL